MPLAVLTDEVLLPLINQVQRKGSIDLEPVISEHLRQAKVR